MTSQYVSERTQPRKISRVRHGFPSFTHILPRIWTACVDFSASTIGVIFANLFPSLHVCEGWGEGDRLGLLAPAPLYSHFQQGHMTPVKLCHNLTGGELATTNQSKPPCYTHTNELVFSLKHLPFHLAASTKKEEKKKRPLTYSMCSCALVKLPYGRHPVRSVKRLLWISSNERYD